MFVCAVCVLPIQTKANPTECVCLSELPPTVVCSHTNPCLRTYSGLLFRVKIQLDGKALHYRTASCSPAGASLMHVIRCDIVYHM